MNIKTFAAALLCLVLTSPAVGKDSLIKAIRILSKLPDKQVNVNIFRELNSSQRKAIRKLDDSQLEILGGIDYPIANAIRDICDPEGCGIGGPLYAQIGSIVAQFDPASLKAIKKLDDAELEFISKLGDEQFEALMALLKTTTNPKAQD